MPIAASALRIALCTCRMGDHTCIDALTWSSLDMHVPLGKSMAAEGSALISAHRQHAAHAMGARSRVRKRYRNGPTTCFPNQCSHPSKHPAPSISQPATTIAKRATRPPPPSRTTSTRLLAHSPKSARTTLHATSQGHFCAEGAVRLLVEWGTRGHWGVSFSSLEFGIVLRVRATLGKRRSCFVSRQ